MPRHRPVLALILVLAACRSTELEESLPAQEQIPAGAAVVYRLEPTLIDYTFTDSSSGQQLRQRWLADQPFVGYNCVALSPRTPTDSIGSFVFVARGPNQGFIERFQFSVADTITGFFIAVGQGSRGTYVLDAQNRLTFLWTNGMPSRYFDPSAALRISADSLLSSVLLSDRADSVTVSWRVVWTVNSC